MRPARRLRADLLQRDAVLVAGGLRAVLLQLAHPAVGRGVADHSDFATDPMRRLWHTLGFLAIVAAGDDALVQRYGRVLAERHRAVVSAPGARLGYDARDPALQLWVAATIHDTAVQVTEAVHGPLPGAVADALLALDGRVATALGLPPDAWPRTSAAFDRAFAGGLDRLGFDPVTLEVARTLLSAEAAPWWVRVVLPAIARATLPTLPDPVRVPLERGVVPGGPRLATVRSLAPFVRIVPGPLRRLPARLVVVAARRAVERADRAADATLVHR